MGEHGQRVHYSVGQKAAQKQVDLFICCGELSRHTYQGLLDAGRMQVYYFEDKPAMHRELNGIIEQDDTVYVKASRGCAFEETVEELKKL